MVGRWKRRLLLLGAVLGPGAVAGAAALLFLAPPSPESSRCRECPRGRTLLDFYRREGLGPEAEWVERRLGP